MSFEETAFESTIAFCHKAQDEIETLQTQLEKANDDLLEWIYRERFDVIKWHAEHTRDPSFFIGGPRSHYRSLRVRTHSIVIESTETWSEPDTEFLHIPLEHIRNPYLISVLKEEERVKEEQKALETQSALKVSLEEQLAQITERLQSLKA